MQSKNVYILFPAGYSGTYLSWCLDKSEIDSKDTTIDDPINKTKSDSYGGTGTSHLYHRDPTHCGIEQIMHWMILNHPKDKRNYLVNVWNVPQLTRAFNNIMGFDRDPIIIHITANDADTKALGNINALTKWPLIFEILDHPKRFGIDFRNLDDSLTLRNKFVKFYKYIFNSTEAVQFEDKIIDELACDKPEYYSKVMNSIELHYFNRHWYANWYNIRNKYTPHEVNEEQFIKPYKLPRHYYNIDLKEIYEPDFPSKLENIVANKDIGDYNFDYVKQFHTTYMNSQTHVKYPKEIAQFRETGVLTPYLESHPLLKALVIINMLPKLPEGYDWESKSLREIVDFYTKNSLDK